MKPGSVFRADIQGLRAIAVLLVVIYHVWPAALPGGYIGVDVFFVISGYLITGLLVKEIAQTGTVSLRAFYGRRIRRLLPAATTVLLVVVASTLLWVAASDWQGLSREFIAGALYVENWLLVGRSVDYLAQDSTASPVQHFWSLSVEEQFYIFWPVLLLTAAAIARRLKFGMDRGLSACVLLVTAVSLAYGIYVSFADPAAGYFLTTTRVWELGLGGLLALFTRSRSAGTAPAYSAVFGWGGVAAMLLAALCYTSKLPFPGYEALLPTLGAAALLYARTDASSLLGRTLSMRFFQYIGDVSYSLYLWHWPVVVFYPLVTGNEASSLQGGVVVVLGSLLLAHLSKVLVEERFRHSRAGEVLRPYLIGMVLTGLVVGTALLLAAEGSRRIAQGLGESGADAGSAQYPGALALEGAPVPVGIPVMPDPGVARTDRPLIEGGVRCVSPIEGSTVEHCELGHQAGSKVIALVGDSHAEHWIPAFDAAARRSGWKLLVYTKLGCAFTDTMVMTGNAKTGFSDYPQCREWAGKVVEELEHVQPALVVVSQSPNHRIKDLAPRGSQQKIAEGVVTLSRALELHRIKVAVVKHTPWLPVSAPECVKAGRGGCDFPPDRVLTQGALNIAASQYSAIHLLDLTDVLCTADNCSSVVGNVLVYRDQHHLTATYARTASDKVGRKLEMIMAE